MIGLPAMFPDGAFPRHQGHLLKPWQRDSIRDDTTVNG